MKRFYTTWDTPFKRNDSLFHSKVHKDNRSVGFSIHTNIYSHRVSQVFANFTVHSHSQVVSRRWPESPLIASTFSPKGPHVCERKLSQATGQNVVIPAWQFVRNLKLLNGAILGYPVLQKGPNNVQIFMPKVGLKISVLASISAEIQSKLSANWHLAIFVFGGHFFQTVLTV